MATSSNAEDPQRTMMTKFIQALRDQGFLDRNFNNQIHLHQNQNSLATFCREAEPRLENAERFLKMDTADFVGVINNIDSIRIAAIRVGGTRVAAACIEMLQFCRSRDVEGSKEAYKKVTWEYYILRDCFHHILQAERTIRWGAV